MSPLLLLITTNILHILATDYTDHVSSGINTDKELTNGDTITSLDGLTRLRFGSNGQVVVQEYTGSAWVILWKNGLLPGVNSDLAIQWDGNLVVYDSSRKPVWAAASNDNAPPHHLVVSNTGVAYMLNSNNKITWSTSGSTTLPTFARPTTAITPSPTQIPTVTPLSNPIQCNGDLYSQPMDIVNSNSIGTIMIRDTMELSFTFTANSRTWTCTAGWCHILRIGPSGAGVRLPHLSIVAPDQDLHLQYLSDKYNTDRATNLLDGNAHSFYFKFTPISKTFVYDGTTLFNVSTAPETNAEIGNVYDIWVCDEGNPYAANGYIWDLCVHTFSTTAMPSTSQPTTNMPTTDMPTTDMPTTDMPTTNMPSTSQPTTNIPTTDMPTTNAPTDVPSTAVPTTYTPSTSIPTNAPITNMPTTSVPTSMQPSTSEPTALPTTDQPSSAIPTTHEPSEFPSNSPTETSALTTVGGSGEQSADEIETSLVTADGLESGLESENASVTQIVVVIAALGIIVIIIFLCIIAGVYIIIKKVNQKKKLSLEGTLTNPNGTGTEMHRVMSLSNSPTDGQHITASSMSNITPNINVSEGFDTDVTDLPVLPNDNAHVNSVVTKGGYENNQFDTTPTGDDSDILNESDDGLYNKPVVPTPGAPMENMYVDTEDIQDAEEGDLYKKPNGNRETLQ